MLGEVMLADIRLALNNRANALYDEARLEFETALALK
jgi:hypothetical protein